MLCYFNAHTGLLAIYLYYIAENLDYNISLSSLSVNFYASDRSGTRRCTTVTINEDTIVEYNERFSVILTENSDQIVIQNNRNSTIITIREDGDSKFKCNTSRLP